VNALWFGVCSSFSVLYIYISLESTQQTTDNGKKSSELKMVVGDKFLSHKIEVTSYPT
jgi:hypothetical protein